MPTKKTTPKGRSVKAPKAASKTRATKVAKVAVKPSSPAATKGHGKSTTTSPKSLVAKYQTHDSDTGSTEVQIARISVAIDELARHLKKHAKDFDSRRGLLIMVGKRRRLLDYLKTKDEPQYGKMVIDLKLRK